MSGMADLHTHPRPSVLSSIPLLAIVLVAYNVAMMLGHNFATSATAGAVHLKLISGADWALGWNDVILACGLVLLFVEIIKSTRSNTRSMFEHMLSMVVFIIFLVEFLIVAGAGTSTFLLLGLMSLVDVLGGYSISIAVARKEMNITG